MIIIKTRNKSTGFSVNLYERIKIGNYVGNTEMLNLTYSTEKFNSFFSYYHSYMKNRTKEESSYYIFSDTTWHQSINQPYIYQDNEHDFSASFDYSFTKKQIVGVQYRGIFSTNRNNLSGNEDFSADNKVEESIISKTYHKQSPRTHMVNAFYNGVFSDQVEFQVDMDYVSKKAPANQSTKEQSTILENNRDLNIMSKSDFDLWAGKLVGTYNIHENSKIEIGTEYNTIKGKGSYHNSEDVNKNNIYTNNEEKFASFINYQTAIEKLQINLGLRYEYTHEKSTEDSIKKVRVNNYYNNIYPNLTLSQSFGEFEMDLQLFLGQKKANSN